MTSPQRAYQDLVSSGKINADPAQARAMALLSTLGEDLLSYSEQMGKQGWAARLGIGAKKQKPPKGLYLWGGVGRGKSMVMDLFFDHVSIANKQRVHFHAFMQEVHRRIHAFREAQKAGKVSDAKDPLPPLARVIAERAWLLCFDEFHVTDIADAMILGRLFEALFAEGVVIVATSNRHPKDLYKDGLQRDRFLPFIDILLDKMNVLEVQAARDYRLERLQKMDAYLSPAGPVADMKLEQDFECLTVGFQAGPVTLDVNGRDVEISKTAEGVAFVDFDELCAKPLGPGDFLAIASRFHTVLLRNVPKLGPSNRNEAKRFVTLIDSLYEAKVNFICSAAVPPAELYTEGDGAFEFERTVSRLMEMQSPEYIALGHLGATG
ncbi:cell division protein ZapE [Thalassospiraceae bacterium LMO-JJ14]|nr:cell division protein ZapE [Thalassospiraceae bacterium LMO-JJ14]